jgi:putative DNA primase/helicase
MSATTENTAAPSVEELNTFSPLDVARKLTDLSMKVFPLVCGNRAAAEPYTPFVGKGLGETLKLFEKHPHAMPGVILDKQTQIVMLDADEEGSEDALKGFDLPATLTVRSRRGLHRFFYLGSRIEYPESGQGFYLVDKEGAKVEVKWNVLTPMPPQVHHSDASVTLRFEPGTPLDIAMAPPKLTDAIKARLTAYAQAHKSNESSTVGLWGNLLSDLVDRGELNGYLKFAGSWRANGTRPVFCPFADEHAGNELEKPSAYLMTQKASGLGCHDENHRLLVLPLLVKVRWADDKNDARKKLRSLGYPLPATRSLQVVTMSDVTEKPMEWLWNGRILYNNLNLLPGDGGIGKSFVTMAIAAAVTHGGKLPLDDGWQTVDRGDVLLVNFEDGIGSGIEQILARRTRICGVDPTRLHVIQGVLNEKNELKPFSRDHVDRVATFLEDKPEVRLVIVDPLMSFIGKADVFRDNEVREALSEIVEVISKAKQKVALLVVAHNRKAAGEKGTDKVAGSAGLVNYSRSVVAADRERIYDEETHEESEGRRMLTVIKGNHAGPTCPIPFDIDAQGRFAWLEVDKSLRGKNPAHPRKPSFQPKLSMTDRAASLLQGRLADGEWHDASSLIKEMEGLGLSKSAYDGASKKLGVDKRKRGEMSGGWEWRLERSAF